MGKKKAISLVSLAATLFILNLGSCDLFSPGLGENVDITPPVIAITDPVSDPLQYKSGNFTVSGTVSDDVAAKKVRLSWPGGGTDASINGETWSADVSLGDISSRGTILLSAVAYDNAGKGSSPYNVNIVVDDAAPTVIVKSPQAYGPGPTNSGYIQIEGETWDRSDIQSVTVNIYAQGDHSTVLLSQLADGTRSWSARITLDGNGLTSGDTFYYEVVAMDMAGNTNSYVYHSADIWDILPDGNLFPAASVIGKWDQEGAELTVTVPDDEGNNPFVALDKTSIQLDQNGTGSLDFIYNSDQDIPQVDLSNLDPAQAVENNSLGINVPIYASATDDKEGIDTDSVFLTVTQDSTDLFTLAGSNFNSPGDGLYTSFQFDLSGAYILDPGIYTGTINLTDKKGTASSLTFSFLINRGAPSIISMTPSSTYAGIEADGSLITTVQIEDDNAGASLIVEAYDTDGNPLPGITTETTIAEAEVTDGDETTYVSTWKGTVPNVTQDEVILVVTVEDTSGLKNTRSKTMSIDSDDPTLVITVPANNDSISGNALTAAGTAADTGSEMYQVYVSLLEGTLADGDAPAAGDAGWTVAKGNETWSLPLDLSVYPEGAFTLFAYPVDIAANRGDVSYVNFDFDLADPVLTMDQGTDDAIMAGNYTLNGNASDSNGIVSLDIKASLNGAAAASVSGFPLVEADFTDPTSYDWTYSRTIDGAGADDGIYDYVITLTDKAGKTDELRKRVTVDTVGPELVVSNLADGDFVTSASFKILGLASDISGIQSVEYSLNGDPMVPVTLTGTGNWELQVSGLNEGSGNTLDFQATDMAGRVSTLPTINFGLDLAVPSLAIDNRDTLDKTWISSDLALTGTTQDASGIASLEISTDSGSSWTTVSGATSTDNSVVNWSETVPVPADGSGDGSHLIILKATDNYGKEFTQSLLIYMDATAPSFTVINLVNDQLLTASPYSVSGTWSDNGGSGTDSADGALIEYSLDGVTNWTAFTSTQSTWFSNVAFPEGLDQNLFIRAQDALGNATSTAQFTGIDIDTALPQLAESTVGTAEQQVADSGLTFGGTAGDTNALAKLTVSLNGGAEEEITVNGDNTWTWTQDNTEGTFSLLFTATDAVNRTTSLSRSVLVDRTAPSVTIDLPGDGEYLVGSSYTVRGTVAEANTVASVKYDMDGSDNWYDVTGTRNWTQTMDTHALGAGSHTIRIIAEDGVGHVSSPVSRAFRIDLNSPTVTE
ncbi:MAG: hypothetical protein JXA95_19715, partial [Spirochaetales bacterium]|nr:hypothetical protein [Spirochaetales bacterium]